MSHSPAVTWRDALVARLFPDPRPESVVALLIAANRCQPFSISVLRGQPVGRPCPGGMLGYLGEEPAVALAVGDDFKSSARFEIVCGADLIFIAPRCEVFGPLTVGDLLLAVGARFGKGIRLRPVVDSWTAALAVQGFRPCSVTDEEAEDLRTRLTAIQRAPAWDGTWP